MLKKGDILRHYSEKEERIKAITIKSIAVPVQFYHICTKKNHNFVAEGVIAHNMEIEIQIKNREVNLKLDV